MYKLVMLLMWVYGGTVETETYYGGFYATGQACVEAATLAATQFEGDGVNRIDITCEFEQPT